MAQNFVKVRQEVKHIVVKGAGGLRGLTGPVGPKGDPGEDLKINEVVENYADLPNDLSQADAGLVFYVKSDKECYVWTGNDYSLLTMPGVDVDDALSTVSENPVQNKVITNKINTIEDKAAFIGAEVAGGSSPIDTSDIAAGAIVTSKIADGAVLSSKLDPVLANAICYRPGDIVTSLNYESYTGFGRGAGSKTKASLFLSLKKPLVGVSNVVISWGEYSLQFFDVESNTKVFADPGSATCTRFTEQGLVFEVTFPSAFTTGGNYEYGFFSLGNPTFEFN